MEEEKKEEEVKETETETETFTKEEVDKLIAEKEATYQDSLKELDKLKTKDLNFAKFREMTEEEKKKLSATETALLQKQEELEKRQEELDKRFYSGVLNSELRKLVGDDEDMKKKTMDNFERIKDDAKDEQSISKKLSDAYLLAGGSRNTNPISRAANAGSGSYNNSSSDNFAESEEGIDAAKKIGFSFINKEEK